MLAPPDEEIIKLEMNPKTNNSFFICTRNKVYYMEFSDFFNDVNSNHNNFHFMSNNNASNLKCSFPDPILDSDIPISSSFLSNKNIILGFEDGKIHVYSYNNILSIARTTALKANLIFSNHRGAVTNIISANRPISQYGLNFNNKIEEIIVKPLKKPSIPYSYNIPIKLSIRKEDHFENLINLNCDENTYSYVSSLYNESANKKETAMVNDKNNNVINPSMTSTNPKSTNIVNNLEDPKFLKKKLAEMADIIYNY